MLTPAVREQVKALLPVQVLILVVRDGRAAGAVLRDEDGRELRDVFHIDMDLAAADVSSPEAFAKIAEPIRQQLAHEIHQ